MRLAAKKDSNHDEIANGLRAIGASVQTIHQIGDGVPDLLVGRGGRNYLLEVKCDRGKLTHNEDEWHVRWNGQVAVVRNVQDALRAVGAL